MDIEVAIAILTQDTRVLMQLRDDVPNIIYPGCWGFFGGHLEAGETPLEAVQREVSEEISYNLSTATLFGLYNDTHDDGSHITRHVFIVPLTVPLTELRLNEGWDMALLTQTAVETGGSHSAIAQQWRPIPAIHQRILLDFFASVNK
ncbi:MAG: NUDIX domain-containing protein [Limnothrix sp. RL_2_0]|nr:NUDIX domain-containing protein [Limnothrix sp. RL_2_0]